MAALETRCRRIRRVAKQEDSIRAYLKLYSSESQLLEEPILVQPWELKKPAWNAPVKVNNTNIRKQSCQVQSWGAARDRLLSSVASATLKSELPVVGEKSWLDEILIITLSE